MKSARFEVYQDKKKGWRFRLVAANGRIIAQGESHTREKDAWRATKAVEKAIFSMFDQVHIRLAQKQLDEWVSELKLDNRKKAIEIQRGMGSELI